MKSLFKILGLVIFLLSTASFGQGTNLVRDPCQTFNATKQSTIINITAATTTQLVALSGTTSIYVCGFTITVSQVAVTPNTIKFVYGTGASCGTGTTNLTGLFGDGGITATLPLVITGFGSSIIIAPSGQALCATTAIGGSASFQGVLTYIQQ